MVLSWSSCWKPSSKSLGVFLSLGRSARKLLVRAGIGLSAAPHYWDFSAKVWLVTLVKSHTQGLSHILSPWHTQPRCGIWSIPGCQGTLQAEMILVASWGETGDPQSLGVWVSMSHFSVRLSSNSWYPTANPCLPSGLLLSSTGFQMLVPSLIAFSGKEEINNWSKIRRGWQLVKIVWCTAWKLECSGWKKECRMWTDSGELRLKLWRYWGGLDFLPQLRKRHDKSGEEKGGPSNGTWAGSGEERGRLWSRHVMGWGPHTLLLVWEGGRRWREKVVGGTQDIWCTSKGRDSRKIWSMRRERGAQGLCEQGVGGLGGRMERKERRKHRADGESGLEAFQSQSRIHVCPKIIISRHC